MHTLLVLMPVIAPVLMLTFVIIGLIQLVRRKIISALVFFFLFAIMQIFVLNIPSLITKGFFD